MEFVEMGKQDGKTLMLLPGTACDYKGGKLLRTKTLGAGGDCCDFHVVKGA